MVTRIMLAAAIAVFPTPAVQADEIKLLGSGAMHEIALELLPQFEKSSGHKVSASWTGTVKIKQQIAAGEVFDLVIVGAPEVDRFIAAGKMAAGSRVDLAKSGVGVAVKSGAPKPAINSSKLIKEAVLAAKSIVYSSGPSGVYVEALFEKLGVAAQIKGKTRQTEPGTRVGQYLARGEGDLGFQQISELIHRNRHRLSRPAAAGHPELHALLERDRKRFDIASGRESAAGLSHHAASRGSYREERHGPGALTAHRSPSPPVRTSQTRFSSERTVRTGPCARASRRTPARASRRPSRARPRLRNVRAQERVEGFLLAQGGRDGRLALTDELRHLVGALAQRGVVRLDGQRRSGSSPRCIRGRNRAACRRGARAASTAMPTSCPSCPR